MHIIKAREIMEGDGVTVRRLFPFERDQLVVDPFVLWDDFSIGPGAGFPTHAHRGFEAITCLFNGSMNHTDNLGNNSTITAGGAQRFTAGRGIRHSEMPGEQDTTTGIQLWINLPKALKGIEPDYQQVNAADIPQAGENGVTLLEIVGKSSAMQLKTAVQYTEVRMESGSQHTVRVTEPMQGIIYLQQGKASIHDQKLAVGDAMQVYSGDEVIIRAGRQSRLMVALGKPHHEAVKLAGGFVD
ncbi:MAG: pirin family protein [Gammaproteobacteria bacterium]|nr:pirin family protein [Gammaproteobacteria bacterium]